LYRENASLLFSISFGKQNKSRTTPGATQDFFARNRYILVSFNLVHYKAKILVWQMVPAGFLPVENFVLLLNQGNLTKINAGYSITLTRGCFMNRK
jgi:hypothetical protein